MEEDGATTHGTLLGGRVAFEQPAAGYRAAIDPVLLAAAVVPEQGAALELGAGTGAASLCLAWRCPALSIVALELAASPAALARRNVAANGFGGRVEVVEADVARLPPGLAARFDAVFMNPPFAPAGSSSPSPLVARRRAHVEGEDAGLEAWVEAARRALRPRARLAMVHRAERLPAILALLAPAFGDIEVVPLWPAVGQPARRVVVRARRGARGGAALSPGLALHEAGGAFTAAAQAVLRDGTSLDDAIAGARACGPAAPDA
ncbi:MAG: methyltransferase [Alphaproteobacteria bacterium]|nr:methyltransferase [Alphaproteobacteria bacterium]